MCILRVYYVYIMCILVVQKLVKYPLQTQGACRMFWCLEVGVIIRVLNCDCCSHIFIINYLFCNKKIIINIFIFFLCSR